MKRTAMWVLVMGFLVSGVAVGDANGQARRVADDQRVLPPGLYVFQTRLDRSTCNEDAETGHVTSYFAAVDGVPGHRDMTMRLLNSSYWPTWTMNVSADGLIVAEAPQARVPEARRGTNHFEVRRDGERFVGRGTRSYFKRVNGEYRRCSIAFDALLRRLHD